MLRINEILNSNFEIRNNNFLAGSLPFLDQVFGLLKKKINNRQSAINNSRGFSLIELLVVIAIFALVAGLVSASYSTFEKNTRLANAASQLKSDLRFAQNKALAGDKSSQKCTPTVINPKPVLVGWYVTISAGSTTYTINSDCINNLGNEDPDSPTVKTISLPKGVIVSSISTGSAVHILSQPLVAGTSFHNTSSPPFYSGGVLINLVGGSSIDIVLAYSGNQYQVTIQQSGEISAKKI